MKIKSSKFLDYKILTLVAVVILKFTGLVSAYDLEQYYPLSQGNSWTYSILENGDSYEEIIRIENKEVVDSVETVRMFSSDDEYECIAIDSEGIKDYKYFDEDEYGTFNPPMVIFPNIEMEESKTYSINLIKYGPNSTKTEESSINNQIVLESLEDVEVPAGKFSGCLKFSSVSQWQDADGSYDRDDCTIWLAPGVGKVKEMSFSIEYEAETEEIDTASETCTLISAVVDGKKIGTQ